MTPESPTPFPLPEIIHDQEHPRTLLEYEFHRPALAELIATVRGDSHPRLHRFIKPRRIVVQGGLAIKHDILGKPEIYEMPLASQGGMSRLFNATYKPKTAGYWLAGDYGPAKQEIYLYPDTLLLAQIANRATSEYLRDHEATPIVSHIKDDVLKRARNFLIEELDHSLEPLSFLAPLFPPFYPFYLIVEERAESKKSDPQLQDLAQQALTLKYLIPDEQILELFSIARDRYLHIHR